jgi:shikimate kinase
LPLTKRYQKEKTMPSTNSSQSEIQTITLPATLQRIVLTGFMGAGKTSVGRILAELLGWDFLDLDSHLEARAGATIAALFETHGEPHFRRLESSALANALSRPHTILALGGGTPEQLTNRLLLEQTPGTLVVFLDAPFETLFDRCMLQSFASPDHIRPVLASPAEAEARFHARQPLYKRLARTTISTEALTPRETAESILQTLAPRP